MIRLKWLLKKEGGDIFRSYDIFYSHPQSSLIDVHKSLSCCCLYKPPAFICQSCFFKIAEALQQASSETTIDLASMNSKEVGMLRQSRAQTPPSSHEEKGDQSRAQLTRGEGESGVTSPNPWASSRNVERPIISQSGVYWNNEEARTTTSIVPLKVMLGNSSFTRQICNPTLTITRVRYFRWPKDLDL